MTGVRLNSCDDLLFCPNCQKLIAEIAELRALQAGAELYARVEKAEARRGRQRHIYFIGGEDGPIKIGIAVNPSARLKELQTGHPARLSVLATVLGPDSLEGDYHVRFAEHRLEGEWFARHPDILAEIERLAA